VVRATTFGTRLRLISNIRDGGRHRILDWVIGAVTAEKQRETGRYREPVLHVPASDVPASGHMQTEDAAD